MELFYSITLCSSIYIGLCITYIENAVASHCLYHTLNHSFVTDFISKFAFLPHYITIYLSPFLFVTCTVFVCFSLYADVSLSRRKCGIKLIVSVCEFFFFLGGACFLCSYDLQRSLFGTKV